MSRHTLRSVVAGVALALAAASPAAAISPSVYPTAAAPAKIPGTSTTTDVWKLVGRGHLLPGANTAFPNGAWTTAVQIAPRWVLEADHASIQPGMTFTNSYGTATALQQFRPSCGYDEACDGFVDLTLTLLDQPINAPTYPKLLDDALANHLGTSLPGHALYAGFGETATTLPNVVPSIGWTTGSGAPDGTAVAPDAIGGDSGGGQFWFPTAASQPVLTGIIRTPGLRQGDGGSGEIVGGIKPISNLNVKTYLQDVFAQYPTLAAPQWVSLASLVGPISGMLPAPADAAYWSTKTTTSVNVTWTGPYNSGVPRTGFKILVNGVVKGTASANAQSFNVTGLKWWTKYSIRVVAVNANGDALPSYNSGDTFSVTTNLL